MNWSVLGEGATFSLVAQSMVFLVLFLLALVILVLKLLFYRPGRVTGKQEAGGPPADGAGSGRAPAALAAEQGAPEEELLQVAAIAAALEMHRQGGAAAPPPLVGQEGPWAPREPHSRPETLQSKSRRWSHG